MPWTIERKHPHVAVVTMNTNKVNAQNPAFFADLHAAFDRLEAEFGDCAVVLTGSGAVFTAGLDFGHHFPLFARRSLKTSDGGAIAYNSLITWISLATALHLPATAIPAGLTPGGLPVGAQLIGPLGGDARCLALAQAIDENVRGFVAPPI